MQFQAVRCPRREGLRCTMSAGRSTGMLKTLVVDDSPTIRRMVIASLREVCEGGFLEAASGLEAIEQLALGPVALIVLDLNMPDMHGLEVLSFVRSHQRYRSVPIVVLTTRNDNASRAAVLDAGASLYLTKPFAPQALAGEVRALLDHQGAAKAEAPRSGDV
jgi:two-component system, chemotaxis family, chemotaxis protein CheY